MAYQQSIYRAQEEALSRYVNARVMRLQSSYLTKGAAVGQLAHLRHLAQGSGSEWMLVGNDLFGQVDADDQESHRSSGSSWDSSLLREPSQRNKAFSAAVAAIELFALRIQSETSEVAVTDRTSFGRACRNIGLDEKHPQKPEDMNGVVARLYRLESVQDLSSFTMLLRQLLVMMKKNQACKLDFARLAVDIWKWQRGGHWAQDVLFAWARDFYQSGSHDAKEPSAHPVTK
jgi:CRISPR type I-E-associated protein CasB/Cse2